MVDSMKRSSFEKLVLTAGLGWLVAGLITLAIGMYVGSSAICSCPAIPANATATQIAQICRCGGYIGYIYSYVGAAAAVTGLMLALLHRRIAAYA